MTITVVTLDDHYLIREGIRRMLDAHRDFELVGEGTTGAELYPLVAQYQPDIVLLDLGMPQTTQRAHTERLSEFSAFPVIARLRTEYPQTRIMIISQYGTRTLIESALEAGVKGYLLKSDALMQNLVEAIRMVQRGGRLLL
jgi:DNA-binding NarL/FixJ family response regulator